MKIHNVKSFMMIYTKPPGPAWLPGSEGARCLSSKSLEKTYSRKSKPKYYKE